MALPKSHIEKLKLRNRSYGKTRRVDMSRYILEKGTPFPKGVDYKDIDQYFIEWVKKDLYIAFEGKELPTFNLFGNQRIGEYSQNWSHTDDIGNLLMNFKTITRDNNPKKGTSQGESYNIPGDRSYPMFIVPTLQENGQEAYDIYTMKQPFTVDFYYTVGIITNKYELINEMNMLMNKMFKGLECYIFPNGHAMPMILEDISDESEYGIGDRKYYAQTYKIKILAYIIQRDDFEVTKAPTRLVTRFLGEKYKNVYHVKIDEDYDPRDECQVEEDPKFYYRSVTLNIEFPQCIKESEFEIDTDMVITDIELHNVFDFVLLVNGEEQNLESGYVNLYEGDIIECEIEREDLYVDSCVEVKGYNPHIRYDSTQDHESEIDDEDRRDEIIIVK